MEAKVEAATRTMKHAVFYSNMVVELSFEKGSSSLPLFLDNTSILHVVGNSTFSLRTNIAKCYLSVQELVEEGKITILLVNTEINSQTLDQKSRQVFIIICICVSVSGIFTHAERSYVSGDGALVALGIISKV